MKTRLCTIVVGISSLAFASYVAADQLDFEDLDPYREGTGQIRQGYKGFSWNKRSYWITKGYLPGTGFEHGTKGRVSLFTAFADDVSLSGNVFSFQGAYITATLNDTEEVIVEGWRDGILTCRQTITTHNDQAYWFDFDFKGIDTLLFSPQGRHIVIDSIAFGEPKITVEIDIKPGSSTNPVNLKSRGRVPVAILNTEDYDVLQIDWATLRFGPGGASPVHSSLEDVDGDGDLDMVVHFKTQETGITIDDATAGLTGKLFDDTPIEGADAVTGVPRRR